MAAAKEIRTKIASVKNTQKITKAMEMVAASKMRKAQERMLAARPYANKIHNVIRHVGQAHPEYHHTYLTGREEIKRIGLIIVSTDRGLCGGLNSNLFREVLRRMKEWNDQDIELDLVIIGAKAVGFFNRIGGNIVGQATHLGDEPSIESLIGTVKIMLDAFTEAKIDQLYLVSNNFINSMTQTPVIEQLLPVKPSEEEELKHHWDYIYEPEAKEVLDQLMQRYIESLVYKGVIENIASEQSARMVAMKSASDNAGKLIDELQLIYNKARQAAITQELSEIVGGAAAV
ncbi:MAG: F0F1 ATP synthase subunit gamma [Gammaproteobacteria bacterium RIFCSPLOWO2_02_FULL_47_50]|jgi:F-type H+-transporting ATPase subunit gamma|nr:MAG: F0F1 ATP synthase subunit gamma [Gammaproteobacteria bacterium RIFCSPLOWO2_01_FULL_47_190]OGT73448.1 MAG: F0F1 ATP synthase subunit gamma [Gammaproteobacteria bacterium RIFCSPLOWO2_12_47_11]OGT79544.1 MAG: F0F1 ATP synthase subunit gamma [Gammaproteobacteria bacterium RIFCSPLOWO2_02_FULL_47_50]OGT87802.1 MAG: F0F1 ATP synthase subunit gamma [Gammaproteobacteria bacterium RIFCSPLOWO2_12_FULL_47_76]